MLVPMRSGIVVIFDKVEVLPIKPIGQETEEKSNEQIKRDDIKVSEIE